MATKTTTDLQIRALLKKPGMHRVAPGLYLRVRDTGAAFWALRYTADGKSREAGMGSYPAVSLMEATTKAAAMRLALKRDGIDPLQAKQAEQAKASGATNFKAIAADLINAKRPGWKNLKHAGQWEATLKNFAYPTIGDLDVSAIDTEHVLAVLRPIWTEKHETATRLRQRIEAVLDAASARKLRSGENPARWKGHLDKLLTAIPKVRRVKHHKALPWQELPPFMAELRLRQSVSASALQLTILTAVRTSDATGALWHELDLDAALWIIPAGRMKATREHRVALSREAVALLRALPRVDGEPLVFPGARKGRPLSNMAMLELLRGMRPGGFTVHGFRSTFRDWVSEDTNFNPEIAERALAHRVSNATEAAYSRSDLLDRRRVLMQSWSDFCAGNGRVIQLASAA
jgi:integrase